MRHFAAGVLSTMAELTALMAPTPTPTAAVPYSWAGTTATWGIDNRSAGVRAICEGEAGTRLEHRQPGGDANPYLATPPRSAGGLHGDRDKMRAAGADRRRRLRLRRGPCRCSRRSLGEAVDRLEESAVARDWLGDDFVDHYVEMKRAELRRAAVAVTDWEIARYLEAL